jgi:hypothetical protein
VAIIVVTAIGCGGNDESDRQHENTSQMNHKTLSGQIAIGNLPPHFGLSISLAFFPVADADSPKPFDGDPPVEAIIDCQDILEDVDLNVERMEDIDLQFNDLSVCEPRDVRELHACEWVHTLRIPNATLPPDMFAAITSFPRLKTIYFRDWFDGEVQGSVDLRNVKVDGVRLIVTR